MSTSGSFLGTPSFGCFIFILCVADYAVQCSINRWECWVHVSWCCDIRLVHPQRHLSVWWLLTCGLCWGTRWQSVRKVWGSASPHFDTHNAGWLLSAPSLYRPCQPRTRPLSAARTPHFHHKTSPPHYMQHSLRL